MNSEELIEWLEKEKLMKEVKKVIPLYKHVITQCVNPVDEEFLIIGDIGYPQTRIAPMSAGAYVLAAEDLGLKTSVAMQEPKGKGEEASENVIRALLDIPQKSIITTVLSGKLGAMGPLGNSFRKFIYNHDHRFMSASSLSSLPTKDFSLINKSMDVDYIKMQEKGKRIKEILDNANQVHIATKAGTDCTFDITLKNAISNDGRYTEPQSGGNMPAGEVYLPPRKNGVEGTVVIDGCSRTVEGPQLIKNPITMTIEQGSVKKIEGGEEAEKLENGLKWAETHAKYPWGIRKVGELGIGINPNAKVSNSTIVSEKALGTAHIALGSNYWFGGTVFAIIHLDQVFRDPVITVDGEKLKVK